MSQRKLFGLYNDDGETVETCWAYTEWEAVDYFADSWDVNDETFTVEEIIREDV